MRRFEEKIENKVDAMGRKTKLGSFARAWLNGYEVEEEKGIWCGDERY